MDNKFVFQNVNIDSIDFVNNKNDVRFVFIDSFADGGKFCGELLCRNYLELNITTDLTDDLDPYFPQFICDVSVEVYQNNSDYKFVALQGGSYNIFITCKEVIVGGTE